MCIVAHLDVLLSASGSSCNAKMIYNFNLFVQQLTTSLGALERGKSSLIRRLENRLQRVQLKVVVGDMSNVL